MPAQYVVSVFTNRARLLKSARDFASKAEAFRYFQREAAEHIHDMNASVLLGSANEHGGHTVLAHKSTDAAHVAIERAFYT